MKQGLHLCPVSINSGDINLAESVELVMSHRMPNIRWTRRDCRKIFTSSHIREINEKYDFIVLGPGGIFLLDETNGRGIAKMNKLSYRGIKNQSGYQWIISDNVLNQINIPLITFAIGWNQFRGAGRAQYPNPKSIEALIKKSAYFTMRHSGDIIATLANSNIALRESVHLCYCPTILNDRPIRQIRKKIIGFEIANDRWQMRYRSKKDMHAKFQHISKAMEHFRKIGYEIHVIDQCLDMMFIDWLKETKHFNKAYKVIVLKGKTRSFQNNYYSTLETIFATRGHAQMIPLGLGTKVVSIISHSKLKFFLEDISAESTGVDFKDVSLQTLLTAYKEAQVFDFNNSLEVIKENINTNVDEIIKIINE